MLLAFFVKHMLESNVIDKQQQISPVSCLLISQTMQENKCVDFYEVLFRCKKLQIIINWLGIVAKVMVGWRHF